MNESHEKAKATRQRHQEAKARLWEEQRAAISAARTALTRVLEREDTTPAEIIQAAELLARLGER